MENKIDVAPCKGVKAKLGPYDVTFYFSMRSMCLLAEEYGTPDKALEKMKLFATGDMNVEPIKTLVFLFNVAVKTYNPEITEEMIWNLDTNDFANATNSMLEAFFDGMGVRIDSETKPAEDKNPQKA